MYNNGKGISTGGHSEVDYDLTRSPKSAAKGLVGSVGLGINLPADMER